LGVEDLQPITTSGRRSVNHVLKISMKAKLQMRLNTGEAVQNKIAKALPFEGARRWHLGVNSMGTVWCISSLQI
jgi:hypothetical protein